MRLHAWSPAGTRRKPEKYLELDFKKILKYLIRKQAYN